MTSDAQLYPAPHFPTAPQNAPRAPRIAARVVVAGMGAAVVASVIAMTITLVNYDRMIADARAGADHFGLPELAVLMGLVLAAVAWIFSATAFIVWLFRARRNLDRLGAVPERGLGWTIGSWFIPFANFVLPYKVVKEVHDLSIPYLPGRQDAVRQAPVGAWWAAWVAVLILDRLGGMGGTAETAEALEAARTETFALTIAGAVALIAAAGLGSLVVLRTTHAQEQLAAARRAEGR